MHLKQPYITRNNMNNKIVINLILVVLAIIFCLFSCSSNEDTIYSSDNFETTENEQTSETHKENESTISTDSVNEETSTIESTDTVDEETSIIESTDIVEESYYEVKPNIPDEGFDIYTDGYEKYDTMLLCAPKRTCDYIRVKYYSHPYVEYFVIDSFDALWEYVYCNTYLPVYKEELRSAFIELTGFDENYFQKNCIIASYSESMHQYYIFNSLCKDIIVDEENKQITVKRVEYVVWDNSYNDDSLRQPALMFIPIPKSIIPSDFSLFTYSILDDSREVNVEAQNLTYYQIKNLEYNGVEYLRDIEELIDSKTSTLDERVFTDGENRKFWNNRR